MYVLMVGSMLPGKMWSFLVLLSAAGGIAAPSGFLLGVDYSTSLAVGVTPTLPTDGSGALYVLSNCSTDYTNCVVKLSPAGQVIWQAVQPAGFAGVAMAVDAAGAAYVIAVDASNTNFAEELSADGQSVIWKTPLGAGLFAYGAATDSAGNLYVVGVIGTDEGSSNG
jgi:hypothetical protein